MFNGVLKNGRAGRRDDGVTPRSGRRRERGQATAEYALVLLAAAALAGLVLAWASGTDAVDRLMDTVLESIIADAGSGADAGAGGG